jgi:hypothetical protein
MHPLSSPPEEIRQEPASPPQTLSWRSAAERNTKLRALRRAIMTVFSEQTRVLRIAWALEGLFNVKTGYAYPSNSWLAKETGVQENHVQAALLTMEQAGAIIRRTILHNGRQQRVIYPASTIIPTPIVGVGGDPQQPGVHNLIRRHRPKTQLEYAQAASEVRAAREAQHEARAQPHQPAQAEAPSGGRESSAPVDAANNVVTELAARLGQTRSGRKPIRKEALH